MCKNQSKKRKKMNKDSWLHSANGLWRPWSVACQKRTPAGLDETHSDSSAESMPPAQRGFRARLSRLKSLRARCFFSSQCSEPANSPLLSRDVWFLEATTLTTPSIMSATVKTCWDCMLSRHHLNKATITLLGYSGYQPRCDSLRKMKGGNKKKITFPERGNCCFFSSFFLLVLVFCRSHDGTTKQWHVCTIHLNIVHYSCFCRGQGSKVQLGTVFFLLFFLSLWEKSAT